MVGEGYGLRRLGVTFSKRPVAHFTFDGTWITPATALDDALLQDLLKHTVMERFPVHRGE